MYKVSKEVRSFQGEINISGSKSESNRLLVIRAYTSFFKIINISDSDDTNTMISALKSNDKEINIGHAGTAMRFLTSYFSSILNSSIILTGSARMKNRPISILVDALNNLGADIEYIDNIGFPPIRLRGKLISNDTVSLPANVSSQYISSLMMLGVSLKEGLKIKISTKITSLPYVQMTKKIIERVGGKVVIQSDNIIIKPFQSDNISDQIVESDWSSASYFFSLVALSDYSEITLSTFLNKSIQGDSRIVEIYKQFGVETSFSNNKIYLKKNNVELPDNISINLEDNPDLAQTIIITCLGLGVDCNLQGLNTLKIKETDRLLALKKEIEKFDVDKIDVTDQSIILKNNSAIKSGVSIDTYNDHRMAMSFAPLSLINPIIINNPQVVTKSYSNFWNDLESLGFNISQK
ncbi:MAG: 3-phosphoshikimate 1-carboxyvinyltransferase [Cryomorphaceae bacterium]|mgnify:FL=1|nr:3-phosphoshikimate 1-carboxyvinyltransferase [Cryomorphaceae bacterium]MDG1889178.1 3-phosphoshikimate 1-carboxyvinyltransferase [Flavobacteriaceae bacterium]MBT3503312.1 3-phosphoshikimate 1-carboxyvinyltransferase [Cryomorphaceae bacterium]MBT3689666.1 3-phosphoshikimate 1-carboxyvinyltransferase [Cryomorphaceae bacterium]MBT4221775.1 3-phosphoshikimate 1-carboxyvinyltransferase [Cryomorphaceae bacterium]